MKGKAILFSFFWFGSLALWAQNYATQRIAQLGEMMPPKSIPDSTAIFICTKVLQDKSLIVNYNELDEIDHLGISLFSKETKELINPQVCEFIERLFLELLFAQKNGILQKTLNEYHITATLINPFKQSPLEDVLGLLNLMVMPMKFNLTHSEKKFSAQWKFESESFILLFPANRELIFGMNKKESDILLTENLSQKNLCDNVAQNINYFNHEIDSVEGLLIKRGNYFILNQLNNDIVCKVDSNGFCPIIDTEEPTTSLKNMLILPIENDLQIRIKHRSYGVFSPEFTIPLRDFVCFFQNDFDSYCFVEKREGFLEATLVLNNQKYNFIHLLSIKVKEDEWNEKETLQAELFTNIPQDNIKSLF